jgi:RNA polymerase sigma-70 factor (ECF subfamily)
MTEKPDTDQLIEIAAGGDAGARAQLLERHRSRLKRMVSLRTRPNTAARFDESDVVQESMVIANARLDEYLAKRPVAFYPWLRQIAWQQLVKFHEVHLEAKKRSVDREAPMRWEINDDSMRELMDGLAGSVTGPSEAVMRNEMRQRMREAFKSLKPRDREIIELLYLEQLSIREVADVLNVAVGTIRVRHSRAIQRLSMLVQE